MRISLAGIVATLVVVGVSIAVLNRIPATRRLIAADQAKAA